MRTDEIILDEILEPFPGLRPFAPEESDLFFGCESQCDELAAKIGNARFVAVVGVSGSGKSSLVLAGLLPSLQEGRLLKAGSDWCIVRMRPGACPIDSLAESLSMELPGTPVSADFLRNNSLALLDFVREVYRKGGLGEKQNLLVLVDQFEELFRYKDRELGRQNREETMEARDEKSAFVKLLLEAAKQEELPIYVVITMRSDFLGDCARFRDLPEAINAGQYLIPRMTRDQRRRAIEGPVRMAGQEITSRLVQRILNDTGEDPDQLPVMQHALMRTWDHWRQQGKKDRPLDIDDYVEIGTLQDALSNDAEGALAEACKEVPQGGFDIVKRVFQLLRETDPSGREIRRPTSLKDLCDVTGVSEDVMLAVLEGFRKKDRSFLMPPLKVDIRVKADSPEGGSVDITHEALLRKWKRLLGPPTKDSGWLAEEEESRRTLLRLVDRAEMQSEGGSDYYLRGPLLHLALDWWAKRAPNQAWASRYTSGFAAAERYLKASEENQRVEAERAEQKRLQDEAERLSDALREEETKERQRKARRLAMVSFVSVAGLAVTSVFAVYVWRQGARLSTAYTTLSKQTDELSKQRDELKAASDKEEQLVDTISGTNVELNTSVKKLEVEEGKLTRAIIGYKQEEAEAERQKKIAEAALASSGALLHLNDQPELGLLLAVEASRAGDTPQTTSTLLRALVTVPNLQKIVDTPDLIKLGFRDETLVAVSRTLAYKAPGVELTVSSPLSPVSLKDEIGATLRVVPLANGSRIAFFNARSEVKDLVPLVNTVAEADWPTPQRKSIWTDVPFAFNESGSVMAVRWPSNAVSLWYPATQSRVNVDLAPGKRITTMALSRDGAKLALALEDASIVVWDIHDPTKPTGGKTLKMNTQDRVALLQFDPAAKLLASSVASTPSIAIWDLTQNTPVAHYAVQDGVPTSLVFNQEGNRLASGSKTGYVGVWAAPLGRYMWSERIHTANANVTTVAFSKDGKVLASNAGDQTALWNVDQQDLSRMLPDKPPLVGTPKLLSFTPDQRVTVTGLHSSKENPETDPDSKVFLRTWRISDTAGVPDPRMGLKTGFSPIALSPNGLMTASVKTETAQASSVASCPDSELLLSSGSGASLTERTLLNNRNVTSAAFSPDSRELLVGTCQPATAVKNSATYELLQYDLQAPFRLLRTLPVDSRASAVAISADGHTLAAAIGKDSAKVLLWRPDSDKPRTLETRVSLIENIVFSPREPKLASVSSDGAVTLWDVQSAKPLESFTGTQSLGNLAFSPDGRVLASGTLFGQVVLWDAQQLRILGTLPAPSGYDAFSVYLRRRTAALSTTDNVTLYNPLAFDPSGGGKLASATGDIITLWTINPADWKKVACHYVSRNLSYAEWQDSGHAPSQPYEKTCEDLPIHPSVLESAQELAAKGELEKALALFKRVKELDPFSNINPQQEVAKAVALDTGNQHARSNPVDALQAYQKALRIDPKVFISANSWNTICWYGSLESHAAQVMVACDNAVRLDPKNTNYMDSRGLALALTGKTVAAIRDFQAFADANPSTPLGEQRIGWIKALQSGGPSPFTPAMLNSLK